MKMEQIFEYMNCAAIANKFHIVKEVLTSIKTSQVAQLDTLLADKEDSKLLSAFQHTNVQKLIFTDFNYIERLQKFLHTYEDVDCNDLNILLSILSDSNKSIDDFSDELLYDCIQSYVDTHDILTSFVYLYYNKTHQTSDSSIRNNIQICLQLPTSYCCGYMSKAQEIRTILNMLEYKELLTTIEGISTFFPEVSFKSIIGLNITTATKFLKTLNSNSFLSETLLLLNTLNLNIEDIFRLSNVINEDTYFMLKRLEGILSLDETLFPSFTIYWQNSDFAFDILKTFFKKATSGKLLAYKIILKNQITFLSFLYHESYYEIITGLNNLSTACFNLVVYALSNKKHRFLSLLLNNKDISIESIGNSSILFVPQFYKEHFNIDSLDGTGLEKLLKTGRITIYLDLLEPNRIYTLNEILLLKSANARYYQFYHMLNDLHIDKRILLTKQLKKQKILSDKNWDTRFDDKLPILAKHLSNKTLYDWFYQDFAHIEGINANSVCRLLMLFDTHYNIVANLQTIGEVKFFIRSFQDIDDTFNISNLKQNFISYDARLYELFADLGISTEFIKTNYDAIYQFWLYDGVSMYFAYKNNHAYSSLLVSNLKLIVKAEFSNKLKDLKYYGDDLEKELVYYNISNESKEAWITDTKVSYDNITIKECDDFISIFQIGVVPVSTCLNYAKGSYSKCLLSNFDSNKKVVNIFMDNTLVGRALFRLTKTMFGENIHNISDVSFKDVSSNNPSKREEHLTLFLEKAYFSGINEKQQAKCVTHLLDFLKQKANIMHITKVMFSTEYDKYLKSSVITDYKSTDCAVYISRSKSGEQYLDSFSGYNDVSKEGHYIHTKCNSILF